MPIPPPEGDSTPTSTPAPPTQPGAVDRGGPVPGSAKHAIGWAVGGALIFPLSLIGGIVGIVCGIVALRRIGREKLQVGRGLAIAGIIVGALDVVLVLPLVFFVFMLNASVTMVRTVSQTASTQAQAQSMYLWAAAYESTNQTYPSHIAELGLIDSGAMQRLLDQYPSVDERAEAVVGTLDLPGLLVDGEDTSDHDALRAALAALDTSAPSYGFAGHVYMRLPAATGDPRIVFSYYEDAATGRTLVTTDDGRSKWLGRADLQRQWERDAAARQELGWPDFTP